jgi:fructose-1,6-bisphosphatase/sedoheptulose 1,7-bisphosphatase-like protein
LKDRTIQEGDAYAAVCEAKEPRGHVRVLGLGPTPQEIGTPGLRALMSTSMQMEIFSRQKVKSKNKTLEQRIMELEVERIAQGRTNVEVLSQHGSNSQQYAVKNSN